MSKEEGRFNFCVAAVLENPDGEILLIKRSPNNFPENIWDIIGGGVEQFENPFDALEREVEEETGISEFKIIRTLCDFHFYQANNFPDMIGIAFWCKTKHTNVQLSDEHVEFKWLQPEEALKISTHPDVTRCIEKFIEEKKRII